MIKKKNKKIILYILASILIMNTNLELCLAGVSVTGTGNPTNESNASQGGSELPWIEYEKDKKLFRYRYSSGIGISSSTTLNLYNMEGESIISNDAIIEEEKAQKAGTWVGVNVTERESASWNVTNFEAHEIKIIYTCTYSKPGYTYSCGSETGAYGVSSCGEGWTFVPFATGYTYGYCTRNKTCEAAPQTYEYTTEEMEYNEPFECPEKPGWDLDEKTYSEKEVSAGETEEYLKQRAYNTAANNAKNSVKSPIGKVQYIKKNSYSETADPGILTGKKKYDAPIGTGVGSARGSYYQEYEFYPNNICINVKTAKVEYRNDDCKLSEGEITLKNKMVVDGDTGKNVTIWHYFIPLDAKKNSKFNLNIITTGETMSYEQCEDIMENDKQKNPKIYTKLIVPYNKSDSNKVYSFDENESHKYNINILKSAGGCQLAIDIDIPIVQKFYNEQEDNTLKGFNFYYKPIDVNNPFPNGIPTNSIWTETETKKLTGTNLNKDNITYIADVTNAKSIRDYKNAETNNKKNLYTSWENMHINGVSGFIENESFVCRNGVKLYKLGCGPANEKQTVDGKTNYLYQSRCDEKTTLVGSCDT